MDKIKNIYISYWFHELDFNPSNKIDSLEKEIASIIDTPIIYNTDNNLKNIGIPRIEGLSSDKKYLFTMSLVNAFLSININEDIDNDEVLLLINHHSQLFYDILKNVYNIDIIYTSFKLEFINEDKEIKDKLIKLLHLSNNYYEDLSFKRGMIKDDYYLNYLLTYSKEYNFNVKNDGDVTSQDLFDRSMITSLSDAKFNREFLLTVIEINDRYAYNVDSSHRTEKEDIRGMILELKEILNKELFWQL